MKFDGKNIIVTGGASGIGKAIAEGVVARGGHAIIVDLQLDAAKAACAEFGEEHASAYKVNLGDAQEVRDVFAQILADFGQVHGLVNNAGIVSTKSFDDVDQKEWEKVVAINLTGTYAAIHALYPSMKEHRYGKIVNIASVAAKIGGGLLGTTAYAASKAGVIGLTKGVAKESATFGITCNCVCPSYTKTAMTANLPEEKVEKILASIPMHRAATPAEIANAVMFYLSDLSSFATGEISDMDGGVTMDG